MPLAANSGAAGPAAAPRLYPHGRSALCWTPAHVGVAKLNPICATPGFRRARLVPLAACAVLLAACASSPKLYVDRADEPIRCQSVAWLEVPERPMSIADQRVRAETLRVLQEKGYAEQVDGADCLVSGVIYTGARPSSPVSVGLGAGRWGGRFGGSVGVSMPVGGSSRTVGNLAIDVIDSQLNAEVWRGTLEAAFRTPDPDSEQVGEAVRTILAGFPDRP